MSDKKEERRGVGRPRKDNTETKMTEKVKPEVVSKERLEHFYKTSEENLKRELIDARNEMKKDIQEMIENQTKEIIKNKEEMMVKMEEVVRSMNKVVEEFKNAKDMNKIEERMNKIEEVVRSVSEVVCSTRDVVCSMSKVDCSMREEVGSTTTDHSTKIRKKLAEAERIINEKNNDKVVRSMTEIDCSTLIQQEPNDNEIIKVDDKVVRSMTEVVSEKEETLQVNNIEELMDKFIAEKIEIKEGKGNSIYTVEFNNKLDKYTNGMIKNSKIIKQMTENRGYEIIKSNGRPKYKNMIFKQE